MLAYHCIFGMYGFWLPNDPRGSGSDYIAVWELFRYGKATKTNSRHSVAAVSHDRELRAAAKQSLKYPPVVLSDAQIEVIGAGFDKSRGEGDYRIHACAVMPEHVHLVVGTHQRDIRVIVGHLRSGATRKLKQAGLWFGDDRPLWGDHGWNVYLDELADVERAIAYVEANPLKEGRPAQTWDFVNPFDLAKAHRMRAPAPKRRIGGAALRSQEEARRKRRG